MLRAGGAKTPPPLFSLSMETIVNNEDLLTEILVLLPLKSLLKLKCVSKHWLALITSHAFSTRRRSYLNSAGDLVFQANRTLEFHLLLNLDSNNYDSAPANVFEKNKPFLKTKMIESCNGLFLCCDDSNPPERLRRYYGNYNHTYSSRFCVWNPTSKRYALLPPLLSLPCSLRGILRLEGISLAFDPSKSLEYKVVAVCQYTLLENCYQIQIYSSKDGTWRVSIRYFNPPPVDFLRGVFCKGTIHWNSTVRFDSGRSRKDAGTARSASNLYFDINQEQLKTMQLPRVLAGACSRFQVSRGGRLYLLRKYETTSFAQFDAYQLLQGCSGRWFFKHCVDIPNSLIFIDEKSEIVRIKKREKSFKASFMWRYANAHPYIESLACV